MQPLAKDKQKSGRTVHVHGVPLDLGGGRRGVDMGPSAVRIAGLGERLASLGVTVVDRGDIVTPIPETAVERDPKKKYIRDIARVCQKLYQQVVQRHSRKARYPSSSVAITRLPPGRSARPPITRPRMAATSGCSGSTPMAT